MKRQYLQLCQTYNEKKYDATGWFVSTKLDGMRGWWDGGISRGIPTADIPYANTVKDSRLINEPIATGLWSRIGKPIYAPDWWLDQLPNFPLDGELYLGQGRFQELTSVAKSHSGTDWTDVKYMVFDSPPLETVLADGKIEIRFGKVIYYLNFKDCFKWVQERSKGRLRSIANNRPFEQVYGWLQNNLVQTEVLRLHQQHQLPFTTTKAQEVIEETLNKVVDEGGEGVVLRSHIHSYKCERAHSCLKHKPYSDAEGVVVGYQWGRQTDQGSRLLGKMGSLILEFNGKQFALSGFNDSDRVMDTNNYYIDLADENEPFVRQGERISKGWHNPKFPIGSVVTFKYRELTVDGLPKEARYFRTRDEN
jgi:DNA ligase-1